MLTFIKSKFLKDEGQAKGKGRIGVKRKGRLPSKKIMNKAGKVQTVYFRPNDRSKSKYINTKNLNTPELLLAYGESFKRMLFRDHQKGNTRGQIRNKGQDNVAWGKGITGSLDKLADKYGFDVKNFDHQQETFIRKNKNVDAFIAEAESIYGELYKIKENKPFGFINSIFGEIKGRIHTATDFKTKDRVRKAAERSFKRARRELNHPANIQAHRKRRGEPRKKPYNIDNKKNGVKASIKTNNANLHNVPVKNNKQKVKSKTSNTKNKNVKKVTVKQTVKKEPSTKKAKVVSLKSKSDKKKELTPPQTVDIMQDMADMW